MTAASPRTDSDEPLVGVVMPVYNGAEYLEDALASVSAQTYENWRCVIVDNRSEDDTSKIARAFVERDPRFVHERYEEHLFANDNHSRAYRRLPAGAAYCKMLQADDMFEPACIERMVAVALSDPAIGIVTSDRRIESVEQRIDVGWPDGVTTGPGTDVLRWCLLHGPEPTGSPTDLLIRADVLHYRSPFLDASFWHSDAELAYFVLSRSDFGFVPAVLTFNRSQPGSRSLRSLWLYTWGPESMRMLLRYGPKVLSDEELSRKLRHEGGHYLRYLATHGLGRVHVRRQLFREFHSAELRDLLEEPGIGRFTAVFARTTRFLLGGRSPLRPDVIMDLGA